jgi:flagellar biogenesis protein FliO
VSPVSAYIVESFVTLAGVVLLAILVLYGARRFGFGRTQGPLELLGRLPLDARRTVYLVKVGKLVYVVGASEGGLVRLGEVTATDVDLRASSLPNHGSFAQALARAAKFRIPPDRAEDEPVQSRDLSADRSELSVEAEAKSAPSEHADRRRASEHG